MVFQTPLAGIENTLWSGSYRLLRCQRGDEVAVPGHRHMMVQMHLSKGERWDLLVKQTDLRVREMEKGIVGI